MIRTVQPFDPNAMFRKMIDRNPSLQLVFRGIEGDARKREAAAAKADPKANRATRVFDPGVSPDYRYFAVRAKGRPEVRFCWTVNRNAAGRFLIFREVVTRKGATRDRIEAILDKRAAIAACRLAHRELIAQRERAKT